ncbi:FHIPEP family type III secretion protein, partial [Pseudoalteromonas sp. Angola-18]
LNMGDQFKKQLGNEKSLFIASGILITMGLVPGMPHLAFLSLGALLGYLAYYTQQSKLKVAAAEAEAAANGTAGTGVANKQEQKELGWDDVQQVDVIGLEVGYRLIPLVDQSQGGELLNRIKGVRKKLSQELGFLVPPVHIRDNLELDPNAYRITLMGVSTG